MNLTETVTFRCSKEHKKEFKRLAKEGNVSMGTFFIKNMLSKKEESQNNNLLDSLNPEHYKGKVQPIELIEAQNLNFNRGNVVKYVCRAGRKDSELIDLQKALDYLEREIKRLRDGRDLG